MKKQFVCLQIHNDYLIQGGETKTAKNIAELLENNGIKVIRYYKSNSSIFEKGVLNRFKTGFNSLYNRTTVNEINKITEENKIDFALVHNVMPIISNSVFKALKDKNIPIIKYIQNYNLICLNGAINHENACIKCRNNLLYGVKNKCYKSSFIYSLIKYFANKLFYYRYFECISIFMSNSNYVKQKHEEFGMNSEKIRVMNNFIAIDKLDMYPGNYKKYYLYFGRLSKEKGVLTAISVFKRLTSAELVIMGSGDCENEIISEISNSDNIRFIGSKQGEELLNILRNAKCVLVPSEWDEPLPRTVLEAYSCGIPVIGSRKGGISEMIDDTLGFTFEAGNTDSLMNAILRFEKITEEEYLSMRESCKKKCEKEYSDKSYFQKFCSCLKEIDL